jgi:hypothetical protein
VSGNEGVVGDMPRGKQFGYLFSSATPQTIAHEIGHGLFHLDHPFDRANASKSFDRGDLADNLMEYGNGTNLVKLQWDAIHAPGLVIGLFERDEDAELLSINVAQNLIALRRAGLYNIAFITKRSSGNLNSGSVFFLYNLKSNIFLIYEKEGTFGNISFTKNSYYANAYNANMYQIQVSDFAVINCLSESDRDVLYDFLTDKTDNTVVFGNETLTISGKTYNLKNIYADIEKIESQIMQSGKQVTATDRLILHIPLIQWQLGWHYGAVFYYNWLTSTGDIQADDKLTSWLQSWNVYKTRIDEFDAEFNKYIGKPLIEKPKTKNYYAINSVLDLGITDPQTNIYILNDLQKLAKDTILVKPNYILQWDANDRKYSNFAITTIAANEDAKTFSAWLSALGSVSIQHCFDGIVTLNDNKRTVINVSKTYIYIRDGFDFSGKNQPLGAWDNNIYAPKKPDIAPLTWLNSEGNNNDLYLTNKKINDFRIKYGIGKDFDIFFKPILTTNLFNKIIINKENNEIIYQK